MRILVTGAGATGGYFGADQICPAVGPGTLILPFLNGMGHLKVLNDGFGANRVLGGSRAGGRHRDPRWGDPPNAPNGYRHSRPPGRTGYRSN